MSPTRQRFAAAVLVSLAVVLSGCANKALKEDENRLSLYISGVQQQAVSFAASRDLVAKAREADIDEIKRDSRWHRERVAQTTDAWNIADDRRLRLYTAVRAAADGALERRVQSDVQDEAGRRAVDEASGKIVIRQDRLAEAAKGLAQLSEQETPTERVRAFIKFAQDVRDQTEKLRQAAEKQAKDAKEQSANVPAGASN